MENAGNFAITNRLSWQTMPSKKEDGNQSSAAVTSQGHSYEWKHGETPEEAKFLDLAREELAEPYSVKENVKETLSRLSSCLSYERRSYQSGFLTGLLRRFLPFTSSEMKADESDSLTHIEGWEIHHSDLKSAESLKFLKKPDIKTANYTVYISASREGEAAALRLCKMLDSIGPHWGLHSSFLRYEEHFEARHYQAAIDSADLFVAMIDDDYGLSGTRSQLELRYAASLENKKSWPWLAAVYFSTRHDWVTEVLAKSPPLFLHGKNPKEHLERMAAFMLSLLIRKKRREQASH